MKLNCLIVDDEPMARKLLQEYIEEIDFLHLVGVAENPLKAVKLLNEAQIDLLLLDINMPRINGIEFLRSSTHLPMVILTTAYGQYALEGFELAVVDYLVKPFSLDRFLKACHKAYDLKQLKDNQKEPAKTEADHFFVKADGKIEKVLYTDLLYVEAMANYVILHTATGKLIAYLTIKGLLEELPAGRFMQVHKSAIVNTGKITAIDGNMLCIGERKITVGASFQAEVMARLLDGKYLKR